MISLPRTVDDPPYFLLWRMDDFAPPAGDPPPRDL